jgi:RimJ/RimL family protein N-acetyltransferase
MQPGDVQDVFAYLGDPEVMRYRACGVQTHEQAAEYVRNLSRPWPHFVGRVNQVVLQAAGKVIGYCYLDPAWPEGYKDVLEGRTEPLVEISYGLARAYWGGGYATEAAPAVVAHGFEIVGLPEIAAAVNPLNVPSIKVLQRIGMTWRRQILWRGREQADYYTITRQEYEQLAQA